MRLQLQQELLPKNKLKPSLLRPLYRSLRVAASRLELDPESEISLLLTIDKRIQELNLEFRNIDKATDVLSFAQDDPILLGDVVISLDTAERQAQSNSWPLPSEVALLGVHGLLHLVGYEDEELEDAQEMEVVTRDVLSLSGIELPSDSHPFFNSFHLIS